MSDRLTLLQQTLAKGVNSLDAEVLLAHVLGIERASLYTWPHQAVGLEDAKQFSSLVDRRLKGEPIAYLVGKKEFWSLPIHVTSSVLIPRPETELIVEITLKLLSNAEQPYRILELGTGSGAISLALAKERPHWSLAATDISKEALQLAQKNADSLLVSSIEFRQGDWFSALSKLTFEQKQFDAILSNPPYIPDQDHHLKQLEMTFEPSLALKGGPSGLSALKKVIEEALDYLLPKGWLIVEHGFDQAAPVLALFQGSGYHAVSHYEDLAGVNRVTVGQK